MLDIQKIRQATPGCAHHIHFDNAGASLPTTTTVEAVKKYLEEEAILGGYELMAKYAEELEGVYHSVAKLINADRQEIALFQSATDAWVAAFNALPFQKGDIILCSEAEYGSNYLNLLRRQKDIGYEIRVIPSDANGVLDVAAIERMMSPKVKLIAITHVPTNGGLVNPAIAIGKVAKSFNCLYLLDACQSVGQLPIDVQKIGCDFLAVTGRKYLRAPRGTGFLYCRKEVMDQMDPENLDLYSADWLNAQSYRLKEGAQRFETFENNKGLRMGLGSAIEEYLSLDPDLCYQRIQMLADRLRRGLQSIPNVECTDLGVERCGIVTFNKKDADAYVLKDELFARGIYTSVSFPQGTLLDSMRRKLPNLIRASVHYYNTESEIDELLNTLNSLP